MIKQRRRWKYRDDDVVVHLLYESREIVIIIAIA